MNTAFGDRVGNYTSVVAHIRRLHFGDVEVACLLGHKSSSVLDDKRRILVEDPGEGEICEQSQGCEAHRAQVKNTLYLYIIYTHVQVLHHQSHPFSVSGCLQG